jgi:hypothetical protein
MVVAYGPPVKHVALSAISTLAYAVLAFALGSVDTVEGQCQDDGADDGEFEMHIGRRAMERRILVGVGLKSRHRMAILETSEVGRGF